MLVYCDKIADTIQQALKKPCTIIKKVSHPRLDLDENGVFLSTKKTITVVDTHGQEYLVTIQEK